MNFAILKELINHLETYEVSNAKGANDLQSFVYWLTNNLASNPRAHEGSPIDPKQNFMNQNIDTQISILIGRMSRYAHNYSKKVFAKSNLSSLEEFTFLSSLMFTPSQSKAELTRQNLVEPTSGADIIKRLVKKGLIEEFNDSEDKRSKQVRITETGKQNMFVVFSEMEIVSEIITGNLKDWEKMYLLNALNKLDHLHKEIYHEDKKSDLQKIKDHYLDKF